MGAETAGSSNVADVVVWSERAECKRMAFPFAEPVKVEGGRGRKGRNERRTVGWGVGGGACCLKQDVPFV